MEPQGERVLSFLPIPEQGNGYARAMANIKSQIKRNRQNEVRRQRNKSTRSSLRTQVKQFLDAKESGDKAAAEDAYRKAARALDKAAAKGVIHKNTAANRKSRLAKRLNAS